MTEQDLLRQTHRELQRVLQRGETVESFQARLQPWLEEKGWAPKGRGGDIPTRLRRIYHTNLRTAHLAGQWDRVERTKQLLPWLVYGLGPSEVHREQHAAWAGLCLRVDDPFWKTHFPPNGWGCKCWTRQVAAPPEGADTKAPLIETRPWTNPATGEIVDVPQGIDPGWDYNAAAHAGLGPVQALTDRLQRLAAPTRVVAADTMTGAAARSHLLKVTAAAQRRLDEREAELQRASDAINDPNRPAPPSPAEYEARTAIWAKRNAAERAVPTTARRAILRERPAPFKSGEVAWGSEALEQQRAAELGDWRRMVAPDLVRQRRAPHVIELDGAGANASYWGDQVAIGRSADPGILVHELSHLLEADQGMLDRAAAFLSRRTAGEAIDVINERGDLARRDKFRNPAGDPAAYPGRVYVRPDDAGEALSRSWLAGDPDQPPARPRAGDRGGAYVYATEILSQGMEWMWTDPLGFAATDPEYFDFIWDTVIRGTR